MFFLNQHFGDKGSADVDKHEGGGGWLSDHVDHLKILLYYYTRQVRPR